MNCVLQIQLTLSTRNIRVVSKNLSVSKYLWLLQVIQRRYTHVTEEHIDTIPSNEATNKKSLISLFYLTLCKSLFALSADFSVGGQQAEESTIVAYLRTPWQLCWLEIVLQMSAACCQAMASYPCIADQLTGLSDRWSTSLTELQYGHWRTAVVLLWKSE
jgi:hypothetical protein